MAAVRWMALKMKTSEVRDKNTNPVMSDCKAGHNMKNFLECNMYKLESPCKWPYLNNDIRDQMWRMRN